MEQNTETKTLSFNLGVTNAPSDLLCDDNSLLECDGFISKDGSLVPIQKPIKIGNISEKIMYVHKNAGYENIIAWNGSILYWYIVDSKDSIILPEGTNELSDISGDEVYDVNSVANTLVVATSSGILYFLFKNGKYVEIGTDLPEPEFVPYMNDVPEDNFEPPITTSLDGIIDSRTLVGYVSKGTETFLGFYDGKIFGEPDADKVTEICSGIGYHPLSNDKITDYLNAVQGSATKCINYARNKNCFCFPFFVRCALKLYDGAYAKISAPIICYPTISRNFYGFITDKKKLISKVYYAKLQYTASIPNASLWKDIVKELVIFASKEIVPYKSLTSDNYRDWECIPTNVPSNYLGIEANSTGMNHINGGANHILVKYKSDKEIIDDLIDKSQFYKLATLSLSDTSNFPSTYKDLPIKSGVVSTLEEQEQLKVDDYFGWTKKVCRKMFPYNKRLNILDYKRYPFSGFNKLSAIQILDDGGRNLDTNLEWVKYHVHIVSDKMDTWVKTNERNFNCVDPKNNNEKIGSVSRMFDDWFYYPDPNATELYIEYKSKSRDKPSYALRKLTPHPMLNGSYSFVGLPKKLVEDDYQDQFASDNVPVYGGSEYFDSNILTSVVNNPFVFEASGDNTVGTGKIYGIVANTEAVSQGQFGQYPLLVFTSEGIYGLSVNSEGLYSASYPISREVCLEGSPLVPTDRLIFFASKKGLMAASGGSVACMSEQLRGRTPLNFATIGDGRFFDFLKNCLIAYDYRDSMLRIFSKDKSYQYIYNMVDKTFSMVNSGITAQAVVNDYPDNLIQDTDGNVYSLTEKPDINEDGNIYSGTFTTRPMKLGGSLILKSLRDIRNLRSTQTGKLSLEIWASNNAVNWCKLMSLKGKPWSFFTFKYTLTDFKASDSFQGTVVVIQNRRSLLRGQN